MPLPPSGTGCASQRSELRAADEPRDLPDGGQLWRCCGSDGDGRFDGDTDTGGSAGDGTINGDLSGGCRSAGPASRTGAIVVRLGAVMSFAMRRRRSV